MPFNRAPAPPAPTEVVDPAQAQQGPTGPSPAVRYMQEQQAAQNEQLLQTTPDHQGPAGPTGRSVPLVDVVRVGEQRPATGATTDRPEISQQERELGLDKLNVQAVDVGKTAIEQNAIDYADKAIGAETNQRGFRGFIKRVWVNATRDFKRMRRINEAEQEMRESGDIYAAVGATTRGRDAIRTQRTTTRADHDTAVSSVVGRMSQDYYRNGETNEVMNRTDATPEDVAFDTEVRDIVRDFANGTIGEPELIARSDAALTTYGTTRRNRDGNRNTGVIHGSNILATARTARRAVEHGIAMDRIDELMQVRYGEARMGVATQARREASDRVAEQLNRFGLTVESGTIAMAAVTAVVATKLTTRRAWVAIMAPFTAGAAAGTIAAARTGYRVTQERQSDLRARSYGERGDARYDTGAYELVSANDHITSLGEVEAIVMGADPNRFVDALGRIAQVEARLQLGDDQRKGQYDFGSAVQVEQGQAGLIVGLAEAKVALRRALAGLSDAELAALGATREADGSVNEDVLLRSILNGTERLVNRSITDRDTAAARYRRNEMIKSGILGAIGGETFALAAQEIYGAASGNVRGLVDRIRGIDANAAHQTLLAGGVGWVGERLGLLDGYNTGGGTATAEVPAGGRHTVELGQNAQLNLPEGWEVKPVEGQSGHYQMLDAKGNVVVGDIAFGPDGHFTDATTAAFAAKGIDISNAQVELDHVTREWVEHKINNVDEYIARKPGDLTQTVTQGWQTNGTPNVFEGTELDVWWGGENGSGIDADGNYTMHIQDMMRSNEHVAQMVKDGKMYFRLHIDREHYGDVFLVKVDQDGYIRINPESDAGKMLFTTVTENGQPHASYIGAFAEAAEQKGTRNGMPSFLVWATHVGEKQPNFGDITYREFEKTYEGPRLTGTVTIKETVETAGPASSPDTMIFPTPVLISTRRGLTPAEGGQPPPANLDDPIEDDLPPIVNPIPVSPRLTENPTAPLVPGTELAWYRDRFDEGERSNIEGLIAINDVLGSIDDSTRAIVYVPVDGFTTPASLRETVRLLADQDAPARSATKVVLSFNYLENSAASPQVTAMQETIRGVITEFSDRIAITNIGSQIPALDGVDYANPAELARLSIQITKGDMDIIALAAARAVEQNGRSADTDALIISLPGTVRGMNRHWLDNYINSMQQTTDASGLVNQRGAAADIMGGTVRKDVREFEAYPSLGVVSDFDALARMVAVQRGGRDRDAQFGAAFTNSAIRLSAYAALGGIDERQIGDERLSLNRRLAAARRTGEGAGREFTYYVPGGQVTLDPATYFHAVYGGATRVPDPEDLTTEEGFSAAVGRIEQGLVNVMRFHSVAVADAALSMAFDNRPNRDADGNPIPREGEPLYEVTRTPEGAVTFRFTDAGRQALRDQLVTQQRGARIATQLHGPRTAAMSPGGERAVTGPSTFIPQTQPVSPEARLEEIRRGLRAPTEDEAAQA